MYSILLLHTVVDLAAPQIQSSPVDLSAQHDRGDAPHVESMQAARAMPRRQRVPGK